MINLNVDDTVGISFHMVILSLLATTIFLLLEQKNIKKKWHTSNNVSILVLIIAAYHYFNMQNKWIDNKSNPVVYRYMDWFITVPLLIIEFYVILNVETNIPISIFYKLLIASVLMLLFGFLGELNIIDRVSGFVLGSIFWVYIVYQILYGELQQYKKKINNKTVNFIYNNLKWIIIVGWAIYPLGYILNNTDMNLVYNIGDFVNKILYALIIWYGSKYIS